MLEEQGRSTGKIAWNAVQRYSREMMSLGSHDSCERRVEGPAVLCPLLFLFPLLLLRQDKQDQHDMLLNIVESIMQFARQERRLCSIVSESEETR